MPTLSELSGECKNCSHVNSCNNKRMVACAFAEMPKLIPTPTFNEVTIGAAVPNMQPLLRDTRLQALMAEQLNKDFYRHFECAFSKR